MAIIIDDDDIQSHYTQVPNDRLRSPHISWKAKGMADYLASHRAGYRLTVEQIIAEGKGGEHEVRAALRELQGLGFLSRVQDRDTSTGRFGQGDMIFRNARRPPAGVPAEDAPPSGENHQPGVSRGNVA